MRILLETQKFGIPIFNYISFSNLIGYILDVLYGSVAFIFTACIIILLRKNIDSCITKKVTKKCLFFNRWILFSIIVALAVNVFMFYEYGTVTFLVSWALRIEIFAGIGLVGIWLKYCFDVKDYSLLLLTMIFAFVFLTTKVVVRYESTLRDDDMNVCTTIEFKDHLKPSFVSNSDCRYVVSVMDFAFTYNKSTNSYTAYPMSEVFSIETEGNTTSLAK